MLRFPDTVFAINYYLVYNLVEAANSSITPSPANCYYLYFSAATLFMTPYPSYVMSL